VADARRELHAREGREVAVALDELEPVLVQLRALPDLKEKSRGTFYRKSQAFLHFHEDPAGLFADVRLDGAEFTRMRVNSKAEQRALMTAVKAAL
jgi:hypothetical protein